MSFCSFFGGEVFQNHFEPGVYVCAKCSYELFSSHSKYAHSSPWPAFTETIHPDSVTKCPEKNRPEALKVSCGKCGNGLGHEFLNDGPKRGQSRFIFSSSLKFVPKGKEAAASQGH
uniref:Methionine-R-sulfoxide reductase B1 n=1 Tax=Mus spicilegus TaxID=10103 RepID=A0A8C6GR33_MUSSI